MHFFRINIEEKVMDMHMSTFTRSLILVLEHQVEINDHSLGGENIRKYIDSGANLNKMDGQLPPCGPC